MKHKLTFYRNTYALIALLIGGLGWYVSTTDTRDVGWVRLLAWVQSLLMFGVGVGACLLDKKLALKDAAGFKFCVVYAVMLVVLGTLTIYFGSKAAYQLGYWTCVVGVSLAIVTGILASSLAGEL